MILEFILIGSAAAHWRKQRRKETDLPEMPKKKNSVQDKFNPKRLVEHIKSVFIDEECQHVVAKQVDADKLVGSINPFLQSNALISVENLTMALLGSVSSPVYSYSYSHYRYFASNNQMKTRG